MEAAGFLKPQAHIFLSQCNAHLYTQLLKHISDAMEKLTVGARMTFLKENYLRHRTIQIILLVTILRRDMLHLSDTIYSFEQLSLVSYIRSYALAYRLKNNLWHIFQ